MLSSPFSSGGYLIVGSDFKRTEGRTGDGLDCVENGDCN